jgi:hypothetical protein
MESTPISTCKVHGISFLECCSEGCNKKTICKLCVFTNKEDLQHCIKHIDSLKDLNQKEIATYSSKTKDYEGYVNPNKIYMERIEKATTFTESIFEGINQSKTLIIHQLRESVLCRYEEITESFELLVKNLAEKLGTVNLSDKNSVNSIKRMKAELEAKTNLLNDSESLAKLFEENFGLVMKRLNNMKINDIIDRKFDFSGNKNMLKCQLSCGDSWFDVSNVTRGSDGYWTVKSNEILEGNFECKIKIEKINSSNATSCWNYMFGLMRSNSTNDSNFYFDSCIIQGNGSLATQFTGNNSTQLFNNCLSTGDDLYMKREEGNVYFALNNNDYKLAYTGITGNFKIVFGFNRNITEGVFELLELHIK